MQRSSCFRLRSSTGPNVLIFIATHPPLWVLFGQDTGRIRTAVDALCRRVPHHSATVSSRAPERSRTSASAFEARRSSSELRRRGPEGACPSGVRALSARGGSRGGRRRQKRPLLRQQFLKAPPGSVWAWVVIAEPLEQLDVAAPDGAVTALDAGLGREAVAALAHRLERTVARWCVCWLLSVVPPIWLG